MSSKIDSRFWRLPEPKQPDLGESRFWVLAQRAPKSTALPFGWSNAQSIAIHVARALERVGLLRVRVVDRRAPPLAPVVVWPSPGVKAEPDSSSS